MIDPLCDVEWKSDGKCYDLMPSTKEDYVLWENFFGDHVDERREAAEFCQGCDVQKRCLRFALETEQIWGVWGGKDESEIRRALWMSANGSIGTRAKFPRCPWCLVDGQLEVDDYSSHQISCQSCGFKWKSETSQQGVEENSSTLPPE